MWISVIRYKIDSGSCSIQNGENHTPFFLSTHHYFVTVSFWIIYPSLFHYFAAIQIRFRFNFNLNRVCRAHFDTWFTHWTDSLFPCSLFKFYFPFIYINLLLSLRILDMRIGKAMKNLVKIERNSTRLLNQQVFSGSYH